MSTWGSKLPARSSIGTFSIGAIAGASGSLYNMNSITLGGHQLGGSNTISIGESGLDNSSPYVNFSLIKANGGTIVQCRDEQTMKYDYYVIPEKVKNFDRELGKIISMQLLKS
jgi:hypothetical protein